MNPYYCPSDPPDLEMISLTEAQRDMENIAKRRRKMKEIRQILEENHPREAVDTDSNVATSGSSEQPDTSQFKRPSLRPSIAPDQSIGIQVESFESKLMNLKSVNSFKPFPSAPTSASNSDASTTKASLISAPPRSISGSTRDPNTDPVLSKLREVKTSYASVQEYASTFLPLCTEEIVEQIIRSTELTNDEGMRLLPWPVVETVQNGKLSKISDSPRDSSNARSKIAGSDVFSATLRMYICTTEYTSASHASQDVKEAQRASRTFLSKLEAKKLPSKIRRQAKENKKNENPAESGSMFRLKGVGELNIGDCIAIGPLRSLSITREEILNKQYECCLALVSKPARVITKRSKSKNAQREEVEKVSVFVELRVHVISRDWQNLLAPHATQQTHAKSGMSKYQSSIPKSTTGKLTIWSISNVITNWREYEGIAAAAGSPNFPLRQALVSGTNPKDSGGSSDNEVVPGVTPRYKSWLEGKYNESQTEAILSASTRTSGFTLIQGPPGTGKTSTLLGIINTLHLSVMQRFYSSALPALHQFDKNAYKSEREWDEERLYKKPHMLVTAPSNTAVDGILKQVRTSGFKDGVGNVYKPPLVRVGSGSKDSEIRSCLLDYQVDEYIKMYANTQVQDRDVVRRNLDYFRGSVRENMVELKKVVQKYQTLDRYLNEESNFQTDKEQLEKEYHDLAHKVTHARNMLMETRRTLEHIDIMNSSKNSNVVRSKLRALVLERSDLVFSTLSGSALQSVSELGNKFKFKVVVVDEAGQAVEPSILVPLQHGAEHCVLVGDPQQLPATVMSSNAQLYGYQQSLFERLQLNGMKTHLLNTQYRCHPVISSFVSNQFYGGNLKNGANVEDAAHRLPCYSSPAFGPMVFYNVAKGRAVQDQGLSTSEGSTGSWENQDEAKVVLNTYRALRRLQQSIMGLDAPKWGIGIITPYSKQLALIRSKITSEFGKEELEDSALNTNTVDGYQGREFDIIIVSCVRASTGSGSIGFLNDAKRLNVAITRAKYCLVVVGQTETLKGSKLWRDLIQHCSNHGRVFDIDDKHSTTEGILALK